MSLCGWVLMVATIGAGDTSEDPFLWLEEVEGDKALTWVKEQNARSLARLEADPRFERFQGEVLRILEDQQRIPYGESAGPWIYNFWQDATNVRGLWRRATRESYRAEKTEWETVLDVDALAEKEKENWVYKGEMAEGPGDFERAMISLSRGGTDASVWREFDTRTKSFVADGFTVPQAKTRLAWSSRDELIVGTDFGPESLTESGYPRILKLWKRGTPLAEAKVIFDGKATDVSVSAAVSKRPEGTVRVLSRAITFFTSEHFVFDDAGRLHPVGVPESSEFVEVFDNALLFLLREDLELAGGKKIPQGSLVRLPIARLDQGREAIEPVLEPAERQSIQQVSAGKSFLNIALLDNVAGRVERLRVSDKGIERVEVKLPANGASGIMSTDVDDDDIYLTFTGFLDPPSLYELSGAGVDPTRIKQLPPKFDATGMKVERHDAVSKDGTKIPYFVVLPKNAQRTGRTPTILYGYGGFEIPMLPSYSAGIGKLWLREGGAYVLACIRGGGEFGPGWHQAALKQNRQRAYDDFIAVAEDLIASKLTSPAHLGIMGASNGGLLVGTAMTQRPDLFAAVVCGVPLLDMIRYPQLLAGASWQGEYGDPDVPDERAALLGYSPYHKVDSSTRYPEAFFVTSTKDDRVHPGHARKMVAKMMGQGHSVLYFENIEGGHGAAANLKQRARRTALEMTYLHQKLFDAK